MTKRINDKIIYYLDYCETVRQMTRCSLKVKRNVLFRFSRFVGNKRFDKINNSDVNDWIRFLSGCGLSPNSINDNVQKVVAMFRFFIEMGDRVDLKIPLIPTLKPTPRRKNYYTKETIDAVLEQADDVSGLMIRICFDTGMRVNELAALKVSDFSGRRVHYMGKGRRWHDSWIRDETYQRLLAYCEEHAVENYLWSENNITHFCDTTVRSYMRKPFHRLGYYDFHPHALRHSFVFNLQRKGASVLEIQHMIGHAHLKTTEEYLHGFDSDSMACLFEKYA